MLVIDNLIVRIAGREILDGASASLPAGRRVGLVGRNGAGKSTLLKILSRIVEPTQGIARLRGRVSSLLEVGTGFHPELTGRENIYLNGAILGLSRAEITARFDEIVDFAEVARFIDTPVKRYSSGMYVRLAFAVAAHLERTQRETQQRLQVEREESITAMRAEWSRELDRRISEARQQIDSQLAEVEGTRRADA